MGKFVTFTLVLFALAALLRIEFFFTIFYLFIGVYVTARFWSRRTLKNVVVTRSLPGRAFLGETLTVTLSLDNTGRLPVLWLLLNETFSTVLATPPFIRQVISLAGKSRHTLRYTLTARRRGYYQIGPLQLETGDMLGINRGLRGQIEPTPLIVYPKIVPMTRPRLPTHSPNVVLPTPVPLFKDSSRITGVKSYTPGDNPRHIHWPATASQGHLLVKQFETAIARETAIFLNLDQADYGRPGQASVASELAVVAAASLANHTITRQDLPAGLFVTATDPLTGLMQDFRLPPDRGRGHLMQILEVLARVQLAPGTDFLARLRQHAVHLSWGTTVVVITGSESEALLNTLILLKRAGLNVQAALVQPAAYLYPAPTQLRAARISTLNLTTEKDVEAWQPQI